jgi:hypothetical protein
MIDEIKKDIKFYRTLLIPSLTSKGDAGYKSQHIGKHLDRFIQRVESVLFNIPIKSETAATPEDAERIFNEHSI